MTHPVINTIIKTVLRHQKTPLYNYTAQEKLLLSLIKKSAKTSFGRQYKFDTIRNVQDFQKQVPIHTYDDFYPWIERMLQGKKNISYPGKIPRFATSSGTTGTSKYLPVTYDSLKYNHFKGGFEVLKRYCKNNPASTLFTGQSIAIGGGFSKNPFTNEKNIGFISAILQKHTPLLGSYFKEPKPHISYMPDRENKLQKMLEQTTKKNIVSISGQPSRCIHFLHKACEYTKSKNILDFRPHFQLIVRGGMSIDLYKAEFNALLPDKHIQYYQIYNASEGCFAVQYQNAADDMLLLINHGIFYEFIPLEEYHKPNPTVMTLQDIEIGKNYVILISNNSGLRRYILGDTVEFTGTDPYTCKVSGRIKYHIDVVGECSYLYQIEQALLAACIQTDALTQEYTVGPIPITAGQKGAYEWIIEFKKNPTDIDTFNNILDSELKKANPYYCDERQDTQVLGTPIIHHVKPGTFYARLQSKNKLGGQNKIPKVANNRDLIQEILQITI